MASIVPSKTIGHRIARPIDRLAAGFFSFIPFSFQLLRQRISAFQSAFAPRPVPLINGATWQSKLAQIAAKLRMCEFGGEVEPRGCGGVS
jgi:hypothetical protein